MAEDDKNIRRFLAVPMPDLFYSEETRQPFERCIDCDAWLVGDPEAREVQHEFAESPVRQQQLYQIVKKIVRKEAVFEFAMCFQCVLKMHEELSQQTRQAVQEYMEDRLEVCDKGSSAESWLETCMICGGLRLDCHEYSVSGYFTGTNILLGMGPHLVCDKCELTMNELISEETRGRWDRFVEEHFDSPPWSEVDSPETIPMLF